MTILQLAKIGAVVLILLLAYLLVRLGPAGVARSFAI